MGKIIYWFWNCACTDQSVGHAHLENQALYSVLHMDQTLCGKYRNPHTKVRREKNQNTNIRFVFLLRILFRYSKIDTFPLTVHSVLELFCQDLYKTQR